MKHLVQTFEYERGWGNKLDSEKLFDTEDLAMNYCVEYDKKYNNLDEPPDWYMKPFYVGEVPDDYDCKKRYGKL